MQQNLYACFSPMDHTCALTTFSSKGVILLAERIVVPADRTY